LTVRLTDTHCHLDFSAFDEDRAQVLARSREQGVVRILNPGTDVESSRDAVELSLREDCVYAGVGIHPTSALTWNGDSERQLRELAATPKVVAMGEIGLDYYWKDTPREVQINVLQSQLRLATEYELPVVLHCREAMEDMLAIVEEWMRDLGDRNVSLCKAPGVFHAYSGTLKQAEKIAALNFYIGITGVITYPKADGLRQVAQAMPLDVFLIETDAPYLTAQPKRGKRNEPAYVRMTAEKIAEIRQQSLEEVAETTRHNAGKLFRWEEND